MPCDASRSDGAFVHHLILGGRLVGAWRRTEKSRDVLVEVATLLLRVVRAVDIVARYGGEEFVVVLPETGGPGAQAFAERLRELIESQSFVASRGFAIRLTSSIGVSSFPGRGVESVEDLLAGADQALYRAKRDALGVVGGPCFPTVLAVVEERKRQDFTGSRRHVAAERDDVVGGARLGVEVPLRGSATHAQS